MLSQERTHRRNVRTLARAPRRRERGTRGHARRQACERRAAGWREPAEANLHAWCSSDFSPPPPVLPAAAAAEAEAEADGGGGGGGGGS